jgi:hypothetical protein
MATGKRQRHARQAATRVATQNVPQAASYPIYARLNPILDKHDFDVEGLCRRF